MTLSEYFPSAREDISKTIADRLSESQTSCAGFSGDSERIFSIMKDYALSGKMLRGILACLGSELFSASQDERPKRRAEALKLAAALEFFQAGLLVHDDIMDKDDLRRGMPTMHKTFERLEAAYIQNSSAVRERKPPCPFETKHGASRCADLGEAMGICVADIYYFIAWNIIIQFTSSMGTLFSRELVDVCLAQIKDVRLGTHEEMPELSETLDVYTYKTARYTICLPLSAGAILADRSDAIPYLEALGLNMGLLFQLQDDYLGLFGDEESLGKPIGSDIREGKKTPFMILLAGTLAEDEKSGFNAIFGNQAIQRQDVEYIRGLVRAHGIDAKIRELSETYAKKARQCLADLREEIPDLDKEKLGILREFIDYSLSRKF